MLLDLIRYQMVAELPNGSVVFYQQNNARVQSVAVVQRAMRNPVMEMEEFGFGTLALEASFPVSMSGALVQPLGAPLAELIASTNCSARGQILCLHYQKGKLLPVTVLELTKSQLEWDRQTSLRLGTSVVCGHCHWDTSI